MSKTFGQAFSAARKKLGPGKTFTWQGKSYSTNRADDTPSRPKPRPEKPVATASKGEKPVATASKEVIRAKRQEGTQRAYAERLALKKAENHEIMRKKKAATSGASRSTAGKVAPKAAPVVDKKAERERKRQASAAQGTRKKG